MADLEHIEKLRKKRTRARLARRLLILTLVASLFVLAAAFRNEISRLHVVEQLSDRLIGMGSGPGWPVDISGVTVRELCPMGNELAVLTDTDLIFYNAQGKELRRVQHGYSNPVMKAGGSRVLLYDTGFRQIRVESKMRSVGERTLEYPIVTGDISADYRIALVTEGERYASEVTVLDGNFDQVYQWRSADSRVMAVALSDRRDEMAVGTVNVRGGELYSTLLMFRFDGEKEFVREELPSQLLHSLRYRRGRLQALSSGGILSFSEEGKRMAQTSFNGTILSAFEDGPADYTVLLLGSYREFKEQTLRTVSGEGEEMGSCQIGFRTEDLTASDDRIVARSGGVLYLYSREGELLKEVSPMLEVLDMQLVGKNLYLLTPSSIEKIPVP